MVVFEHQRRAAPSRVYLQFGQIDDAEAPFAVVVVGASVPRPDQGTQRCLCGIRTRGRDAAGEGLAWARKVGRCELCRALHYSFIRDHIAEGSCLLKLFSRLTDR